MRSDLVHLRNRPYKAMLSAHENSMNTARQWFTSRVCSGLLAILLMVIL